MEIQAKNAGQFSEHLTKWEIYKNGSYVGYSVTGNNGTQKEAIQEYFNRISI